RGGNPGAMGWNAHRLRRTPADGVRGGTVRREPVTVRPSLGGLVRVRAGPRRLFPGRITMIWRLLIFMWIATTMVVALLSAPLVPVLQETTRVLYFHIPSAWITVVALGWSMVNSLLYLVTRDLRRDDHAAAAAELGLVFCIVATVTGSIWAKSMWGSWWNWDPRETSIFFVLLIYGAYLALRGSIEGEEKRAR